MFVFSLHCLSLTINLKVSNQIFQKIIHIFCSFLYIYRFVLLFFWNKVMNDIFRHNCLSVWYLSPARNIIITIVLVMTLLIMIKIDAGAGMLPLIVFLLVSERNQLTIFFLFSSSSPPLLVTCLQNPVSDRV